MNKNIHKGDEILYSDSQTSKSVGLFMGIVPQPAQKDRNVIMIVDGCGNAKRVSEVYYQCQGSRCIQVKPQHLIETIQVEAQNTCAAVDARKELVTNKSEAVDAFLTTDGELHGTKKEADQAQLKLDFYEWAGHDIHNLFGCSRNRMLDYMRENKKELTAYLRRIK